MLAMNSYLLYYKLVINTIKKKKIQSFDCYTNENRITVKTYIAVNDT